MTVETSLQYELTPFQKLIFSTVIYQVPELEQCFFQGFPRELDVNILKHMFLQIGCSRHLMLTACEVFDIHHSADNSKMKLIYVSITVKISRHLVIWHPF